MLQLQMMLLLLLHHYILLSLFCIIGGTKEIRLKLGQVVSRRDVDIWRDLDLYLSVSQVERVARL